MGPVDEGRHHDWGAKSGASSVVLKKRHIEWQASEYIHHDKGSGWLFILAAVALVAAGAAIWYGLWMFAFLIVMMAVAFGFYAIRKPLTMNYELNDDGLTINKKTYPLSGFSAFGVLQDGAFFTIRLIPSKRLSPAILIYFAEEDGENIVDILGSHIPMEEMQPDLMDALMRKLRF